MADENHTNPFRDTPLEKVLSYALSIAGEIREERERLFVLADCAARELEPDQDGNSPCPSALTLARIAIDVAGSTTLSEILEELLYAARERPGLDVPE